MTDTQVASSIVSNKIKKSKTPNVVRATLMVLDEIDMNKVGEDLVKKTAVSALELGEAYYANSNNFNSQVDKTIFFVTLIRDKITSVRDRYDLLLSGLNYIKDTDEHKSLQADIEDIMSLRVDQSEILTQNDIKDKSSERLSQSSYKTQIIPSSNLISKRQVSSLPNKQMGNPRLNQAEYKTGEDKSVRQSSRKSEILSHLSDTPQSIKDIASKVIGCSEKTVQRELNSLLEERAIVRIGEKRWSKYLLA